MLFIYNYTEIGTHITKMAQGTFSYILMNSYSFSVTWHKALIINMLIHVIEGTTERRDEDRLITSFPL